MRKVFVVLSLLLLGIAMVSARELWPASRAGKERRPMGIATFGAGCFWGVEAAFRHVLGGELPAGVGLQDADRHSLLR
jgi:hypothetical protein